VASLKALFKSTHSIEGQSIESGYLEKAPVSNTGKKTGFYHIISTAKAGAQIHFSLVEFLEKAVKIGGKHCCFY
jgi:hypothetical protein